MTNNCSNTEISAVSAGAVIIALLFLFVWPGPLRYEYKFHKTGIVRIDKLNGNVWQQRGGHYTKVLELREDSVVRSGKSKAGK